MTGEAVEDQTRLRIPVNAGNGLKVSSLRPESPMAASSDTIKLMIRSCQTRSQM